MENHALEVAAWSVCSLSFCEKMVEVGDSRATGEEESHA